MYIISKYKDYYDSAVGMGIDKTIVYERHLKEMQCPDDIKDVLKESHDWGSKYFTSSYGYLEHIPKGQYNTSIIIIGFCGKLHIGIKFTKEVPTQYYYDRKYHTEIIYDHTEIVKRLAKNKRYRSSWEKEFIGKKEIFNNYVTRINAVDTTEWFRRFNTPIFAFGIPIDIDVWEKYGHKANIGNDFFINPILKDYQFAKVFDPYTAFQEIQMYVSGVLGVNKDGTEFPATEKQKVAQHGMDKWSFRREPKR